MKKYYIKAEVHYSGNDTIFVEINAESQEEAENKFDALDLSDFVNLYNADFDIDDFDIYTDDEDDGAVEERCTLTKDLPL